MDSRTAIRSTFPLTFPCVLAAALVAGGIQSAQIDAILVMTKSEYDALDKKDARTLYLLEG